MREAENSGSPDVASAPTSTVRLRDRLRGEFVGVGVALGSGVGAAARAATGNWFWVPIVLTGGVALGALVAVALRAPPARRRRP